MQIQNMISRYGNSVPNQFIARTDKGRYFQSYKSIIVFIDIDGNVTLDKNKWKFSKTTGFYRNQFLGESLSETRKKIKSGEYKLDDLNNDIKNIQMLEE